MLRPVAEKLITKAKRGDLHNRREVLKTVRDKSVVHVLFTEIAPTFAERPGGYTRITKIGPRKGDNAPMAVIELVTEAYEPKAARAEKKPAKKTAAKTAPAQVEEEPVDEAPAEEAEARRGPGRGVRRGGRPRAGHRGGGCRRRTSSRRPRVASPASTPARTCRSRTSRRLPEGFPIKGNEDSMKFHEPDGQWYEQTVAEVWFDSVESAEAAGFTRAGE